jgi:hypothetical protein
MNIFHKVFLLTIIVVAIFSCVTASAMTESERQTLIAQIQQQIAVLTQQLQQMLAQQASSSTWCYTFNYNLGFAQSGTEPVANLHIALNKQGISYAPDAINVYAIPTESAVKRFQTKYGINPTGYVGPVTREKLNDLYGCQTQTTEEPEQTTDDCTENWTCTSWSTCTNGTQTKTCRDTNNCGTTNQKPTTTQSCTASCSPTWQCGAWSACTNGTKTRTCTDTKRCSASNLTREEFTTCCVAEWECSNWSSCENATFSSNQKTRTCTNTCTHATKTEEGVCVSCWPAWDCGYYGPCREQLDGTLIRTRTCKDAYNCGTDLGLEAVSTEQCSCELNLGRFNCTSWSTCGNSKQEITCTYESSTVDTATDNSHQCFGKDGLPYSYKKERECYSAVAGGVTGTKRTSCVATGGTMTTGYCNTISNYPNTCMSGIGACSANVEQNKIEACTCGAGKCWNGSACVGLPSGMTQENIQWMTTAPATLTPKIVSFGATKCYDPTCQPTTSFPYYKYNLYWNATGATTCTISCYYGQVATSSTLATNTLITPMPNESVGNNCTIQCTNSMSGLSASKSIHVPTRSESVY